VAYLVWSYSGPSENVRTGHSIKSIGKTADNSSLDQFPFDTENKQERCQRWRSLVLADINHDLPHSLRPNLDCGTRHPRRFNHVLNALRATYFYELICNLYDVFISCIVRLCDSSLASFQLVDLRETVFDDEGCLFIHTILHDGDGWGSAKAQFMKTISSHYTPIQGPWKT
jgi:hypothetical protein